MYGIWLLGTGRHMWQSRYFVLTGVGCLCGHVVIDSRYLLFAFGFIATYWSYYHKKSHVDPEGSHASGTCVVSCASELRFVGNYTSVITLHAVGRIPLQNITAVRTITSSSHHKANRSVFQPSVGKPDPALSFKTTFWPLSESYCCYTAGLTSWWKAVVFIRSNAKTYG